MLAASLTSINQKDVIGISSVVGIVSRQRLIIATVGKEPRGRASGRV